MHQMRLGERGIKWIQRYISCAKVSILVNDTTSPSLNIVYGLRQMCPLSLLLFNLVAEVFSRLIDQFQLKGWLSDIVILCLVGRMTFFNLLMIQLSFRITQRGYHLEYRDVSLFFPCLPNSVLILGRASSLQWVMISIL